MQLADIDRQLDELVQELGAEPPKLANRSTLSLEEADAVLDTLAKEAALVVPLPPPTRLPTDPPVQPAAPATLDEAQPDDGYESFSPRNPSSSMPAGVSSSEAPEAGGAYVEVPPASSIPQIEKIPHRPPSSLPPAIATATFPSEIPSERPVEAPPVSRSFAPPRFSDSSVPPPTGEQPAMADSEPPPGQGPESDEEADIMKAISEPPPEFADIPSLVRPGRDEPTEVLDLADDDLEEMSLDEIEVDVDWESDDDAPTVQDGFEAALPSQGEELAGETTNVTISSRPPPLQAATGGSSPPDENDWKDEFEDAFDILVDPEDET